MLGGIKTKFFGVIFATLTFVGCSKESDSTKDITDTAQNTSPPNIIFILADDHRWDLLGRTHPIIKTPNLDLLAEKGVSFNNAFVTTPICAASRATFLTGLYERTHDYSFTMPPVSASLSVISYPEQLKANGYRSGFVGKFGTKLEGEHTQRFDYFESLKQAKMQMHNGKSIPQSYYIAERANDFIEKSVSAEKGTPWTLSISFWDPHAHDSDEVDQFHYPAEFEDLYTDVTIPPSPTSQDKYFNALPDFLKKSLGRIRWEWRFGSEEIYQKMVKRHYRAITGVDKAVGMVYKKLVELGVEDNTVIIYTGDNGYSMNDRQLAGKWFGWDEDLRVPLIIFDPRTPATHGKTLSKMALNVDIAPTILELAGVNRPDKYQGKSLVPLLAGDKTAAKNWPKEFFFEHMYAARNRIPSMEGVRTEDWKYVRFYKNGNYEQLYNIKTDTLETTNLAKDKAYLSVLNELREKTDAYITQYSAQRDGPARTPFAE